MERGCPACCSRWRRDSGPTVCANPQHKAGLRRGSGGRRGGAPNPPRGHPVGRAGCGEELAVGGGGIAGGWHTGSGAALPASLALPPSRGPPTPPLSSIPWPRVLCLSPAGTNGARRNLQPVSRGLFGAFEAEFRSDWLFLPLTPRTQKKNKPTRGCRWVLGESQAVPGSCRAGGRQQRSPQLMLPGHK